MNYLKKHWKGELSLPIAFLINTVLLRSVISAIENWMIGTAFYSSPTLIARIYIITSIINFGLIYPWQIIGTWRTCNRYIQEKRSSGWVLVVRVLIIFGLIGTISYITLYWPVYKEVAEIGFNSKQSNEYSITLEKDNTIIYLTGNLGYGVSKKINILLKQHHTIKSIVLDTPGGKILEGRNLARLIKQYNLDTYSLRGCGSAGTIAFVAGKKRYLAIGANLGFHQYKSGIQGIGLSNQIENEQSTDLIFFKQQGIQPSFLIKIFQAEPNEIWYPTIDEMLEAGVIHGIIDPSKIIPVQYPDLENISVNKDFLLSFPIFDIINKHDPKLYQLIKNRVYDLADDGASPIEIQHKISQYIMIIVGEALPKASNKAVVKFQRQIIILLKQLKNIDPWLCLKAVYPQQYGPINYSKYFSIEETKEFVDAFVEIIVSAYEQNNSPVDNTRAEELITKIIIELGDNCNYLLPNNLKNKTDYMRCCEATIQFMDLILREDDNTAGNAIRYLATQE